MKKTSLLVIANDNLGFGLSGGDRIVVNLIKCWSKKLKITGFGSEEAKSLLSKYGALPPTFIQSDQANQKEFLNTFELFIHQLRRTTLGIFCTFKNRRILKDIDYVYTSSDFYPDLLLGFLLKLINPKIVWLAGYYLLAPNPFCKESNYNINHQFFRGFLYYLSQIPSSFIAKNFADYLFVTSAPDINHFKTKRLPESKILIIQGGVDDVNYSKFLHSKFYISPEKRKYDAVYLGRFHTQKGVTQLVEIWHYVIQKIPGAELIMIGNGDLEDKVKTLIKHYHLQKNITLTGFMDGEPKNRIFQNSKIVVHPAIYDSGGMAAAEAMSWGLPGVSFDLPALKTYYPSGMIKSQPGNLKDFSANIVKLLQNKTLYQQQSQAAVKLIKKSWNWSTRFDLIYKQVFQ